MQENPKLKIDWASFEAAKHACEKWHYSGVIPVGKLVKVGAWENDKFIGVVLFGRGANNNMYNSGGFGGLQDANSPGMMQEPMAFNAGGGAFSSF